MPSSPTSTDTAAPVRLLDRARAALRIGDTRPAVTAARAQRAQHRNEARADRAHRLAVARFGAYPAGPGAATLRRRAWGA